MVRFLIKRPIAVIMTVLAIILIGIYAYITLPVSLLPDLDIPEITIRVDYPLIDARNLENTIVKPLRNKLSQVAGIVNIKSNTSNGMSEVVLSFSHSVNTNYATIETNEKLDEIMSIFPRDMERPMVIKSKPSDIPVFYLSVVPTKEYYKSGKSFTELSNFTTSVIKRRLEQLSEISMVDISGIDRTTINIIPDNEILSQLNLNHSDISSAIKANNLNISNLSFKDGHYTYRLKVVPVIKTLEDIKHININVDKHNVSLDEIAEVKKISNAGEGMFIHNGSRAISIAVYKHMDARLEDIGNKVDAIINDIHTNNPNINIEKERDQTKLLSYSMENLKHTLIIGLILAVIIVFVMMNRFKLSLIVSISVPISLIITFLGLKIAGISINIISLSGMIFSVGLMIDNSIIIIDNINQHHSKNQDITSATIAGTNEVIRPLISSMLTTCSVFIPLIMLSGISGALFYDQAITISISLVASLLISIMLIPVLYHLLMQKKNMPSDTENRLLVIYEKCLVIVLKNKVRFLLLFFLLIPVGIILFFMVEKEKFPHIDQNDLLIKVDWNEPISLNENRNRILVMLDSTIGNKDASYSCNIGKSSFYLHKEAQQNTASTLIYVKLNNNQGTDSVRSHISNYSSSVSQTSILEFLPSRNIFQSIFKPQKENISLKFRNYAYDIVDHKFVKQIDSLVKEITLTVHSTHSSLYELYEIRMKTDLLLLYDITNEEILDKLKIMFGTFEIDKLQHGNFSYAITLTENPENLHNKIQNAYIHNQNDVDYPLKNLVSIRKVLRLKNIESDQKGEFYKVDINSIESIDSIQKSINKLMEKTNGIGVDIEGSIFEKRLLFEEFLIIMIISLTLLYLILAAQFESLLLPIIILLEILFDISGALLFIYIFNSSLNIMSALGIVVMSGIIINDSIIKIDTIKKTSLKGSTLVEAIKEGGRRRFNPIIMTSITTILALIPFLFFEGLGVELQLPLALAIIGGLTTGTIVSLFFIPIMYMYFEKLSSLRL